jgi:phosphohistidine phosphatase SixA
MRHCLTDLGEQMDADRSLNDIGEEQAHVMRKFLKRVNVKLDLIVSSDFARAHDTAKVMQRGDTPLVTTPLLQPQGDASKAWKFIAKEVAKLHKDPDDPSPAVLIVTHSPIIYQMVAAAALPAFVDENWNFHHGAILYANTHEARFRWYVNPKLAAHVVKEDPKEVENPIGESGRALYAEGCIAIAENLRRAHKAAAVDPLIDRLKSATAARFRKQFKRIKIALRKIEPRFATATYGEIRMAAQHAIKVHDPVFSKVFSNTATAARDRGRDHVTEQLGAGSVKEARKPTTPVNAPPKTAEQLESELDDTTDRETGDKLKDSFSAATPLGYAAVLDVLRQQFKQYADGVEGQTSRAETVAVTEISGAYHDGGAEAASDAPGTVLKSWDTEDDPCETCQGNSDMGEIPEDEPFDSGDTEPPAHPNCRCSVSYRTASDEE